MYLCIREKYLPGLLLAQVTPLHTLFWKRSQHKQGASAAERFKGYLCAVLAEGSVNKIKNSAGVEEVSPDHNHCQTSSS